MNYPSTLMVGRDVHAETYEISGTDHLIGYDPRLDTTDILACSERLAISNDLEAPRIAHRSINVDWFKSCRDDPEFPSALFRVPGVNSVAPVYTAKDPKSAIGAVPDFNTINVLLKHSGVDTRVQFVELGFERDEKASLLLKPYSCFRRIPSQRNTPDNIGELLRGIQRIRGVEHCEFDWLKLDSYTGDSQNSERIQQWNLDAIGIREAHDHCMGCEEISIAVIDSGFDLEHSALSFTPNVPGNFTHFNAADALAGSQAPYQAASSRYGHGTEVSGIVSAYGLIGDSRVLGVAPSCRIMPISLGAAPTANRLAACLNWAISQGCRVVSMSVATVPTDVACSALKRAWNAGAVLCASAGNYQRGKNNPGVTFPASHQHVIAVGAADHDLYRKRPGRARGEDWGSAYGPEIDVIAPGMHIWTTSGKVSADALLGLNGDSYTRFSGTSAAAPHVAGLAALLLSIRPDLSNQAVRRAIELTCNKVHKEKYAYQDSRVRMNGSWSDETGHGSVDAAAAVQQILTSDA